MKKTLAIIALVILALAIIAFGVHCYTALINGTCPLCGAAVNGGEMVLKGKNTLYRYTCTEHAWHLFDLYWRVR